MCDFSLESVKSRAAEKDEDLVVKQFATSKGFVSVSDADCAVCCKDGVEMTLHLVNGKYETRELASSTRSGETIKPIIEELGGEIPVTFCTLDLGLNPYGGKNVGYKDGLVLPNGRYLSMQRLPIGTRATVTRALPAEIISAANGYISFKEEVESDYPIEAEVKVGWRQINQGRKLSVD